MKRILLSISALFLMGSTIAQDCTDLFISEYVEGWSNNKALEIYNPTNQTIDLSGYFVSRYRNGLNQAEVSNSVQLTGMIAPHSTYVAVIEKLDPQGQGQEAPVWDSLQAKADGFYCADYNTSNAMYFNGDDALILYKGSLNGLNSTDIINSANIPTLAVVDVFGKVGEQPLNENGGDTSPTGGWSTAFPYAGGPSGGVIVTVDHSMIRKSTVLKGQTNPVPSFFDPLLEWDTIPAVIVRLDQNGDTVFSQGGNPILDGNWESLGMHDCNCAVNGIEDNEMAKVVSLYPNPSNGKVTISSTEEIVEIKVYAINGVLVYSQSLTASTHSTLNLSNLEKGTYLVNFRTKSGLVGTDRLILE
ncbi:MAG: lamin tail domain-containing protein [Crocinitomicaceae bacterium]|nr:lamin tail domain-containing protein [Crocinitomicaceae bacterium]